VTPVWWPLRHGANGFTVVETVIAVGMMMAVACAVFTLMNPAQGIFQAQTETADMQQRLRVGVDAIYHDLAMAGAGPLAVGPLGHDFPTVLPFRRGAQSPDLPGTFRSDRVSLLYVPPDSPHTRTNLAMSDPGADVRVDAVPGCPGTEPLCGFRTGRTAIIFDDTGAYDTFRISGFTNAPAAVQHADQPLLKAYAAGSHIAEIVAATYWLKTDTPSKSVQLMRYDGYQTDLPVADDVVGLSFEYYGDPEPPALFDRPAGVPGRRTSYGPKPPALGVDDPTDLWAAGENCIFRVEGGRQVVRHEMAVLGATGALVALDSDRLTDGPWCPDEASSVRVDADLLRVRRIRVRLRVQVALEALRGTGILFARAGTSRGGERYVPDREVTFDVSPRNLNLGR
jgi:hypothetical protein